MNSDSGRVGKSNILPQTLFCLKYQCWFCLTREPLEARMLSTCHQQTLNRKITFFPPYSLKSVVPLCYAESQNMREKSLKHCVRILQKIWKKQRFFKNSFLKQKALDRKVSCLTIA